MDIYIARRRHLKHLIATEYGGSQKAFANQIGVKPSQISRWVSDTTSDIRNISELSARNIEERCGKPQGWLDAADLVESLSEDLESSANDEADEALLLQAWRTAGKSARREALVWARTVLACAEDSAQK
ncbi:helix-turn-helix domain-containing protein [Burkholderia aenigmatica]|uniref:helix-turn-helix domain-containing protein n=1 Tax=Burkholderia aenigmatica TaxID=2015348 RepID=UPI0026570C0F|nr:helix-turn-helix domain-containing protein [Burkholderia aenigmatica]MDN7881414.1 helix-turn-helix domain-containing protein [Burkholderia aenigmatica]